MSNKKDDVVLPAAINLKNIALNKNSRIIYMDAPYEKIKFQSAGGSGTINIPPNLQNKVAGKYAVALKIVLSLVHQYYLVKFQYI